MRTASQTAVVSAMFRAAHGFTDPDPIFQDPYALALAGCSEDDVVAFFDANTPAHGADSAHVARLFQPQRSRFVEEEVQRVVDRGVTQFVDLGAGLSSFAWRRPDLMDRLTLFEVDHPASQAYKRERLEAVGLHCPPSVRFASVDFASDDSLVDALTTVGFDPSQPSIWSWLGVIIYLPVDAIRSTLKNVAALASPGSALIASFGVPDELMEPASREFAALSRAWTEQAGEPQITWLPPDEIETFARDAGWTRVHSIDPATLAPWFADRADGLQPVRYEWLLAAGR